jgi:dihydroorotate dehydrogenase
MKEHIVRGRNAVIGAAYRGVLKPIFFACDPEDVHDNMVRTGHMLGGYAIGRSTTQAMFGYENPLLEQTVLGIRFKNPVGLAAGFDKNAELTRIIGSVGFGFEEIGSITGEPCLGNPKPRLWRLPESQGLVVNYGLKNDGCEAIAARLRPTEFSTVIGTSVAMTNCAENSDTGKAIADYAKAFAAFAHLGSYTTINISCPNTLGGQPFIIPENLDALLVRLDTIPTDKPVFVKLSPDLSTEGVDDILAVLSRHRVQGIICTNLTKRRDNPAISATDVMPAKGGISGAPVRALSDALISHIYKKTEGKFILIGCGGIFSAEDAYRKIRLGATLLQLATGMIFQGPQTISGINQGLVRLLKRDGFASISEAVGIGCDTM